MRTAGRQHRVIKSTTTTSVVPISKGNRGKIAGLRIPYWAQSTDRFCSTRRRLMRNPKETGGYAGSEH